MFVLVLGALYTAFALILFLALIKPRGYVLQNSLLACFLLAGGLNPIVLEPTLFAVGWFNIPLYYIGFFQPLFLLAIFGSGLGSVASLSKLLKIPVLVYVLALFIDVVLLFVGRDNNTPIFGLVASVFVYGFSILFLWPYFKLRNVTFYKKNKSLLGFVVILYGFSISGGIYFLLVLPMFPEVGVMASRLDLTFKVASLFGAIVVIMRDVKGMKSISELYVASDKPSANVNSNYIEKLEQLIRQEKVYLEAGLTVESLAVKMSISERTLSTILNGYYKCNFFEFINQYRIEEAKRLLRSEDYRELAILNVMYDAGFNSKATFNNMFKKVEGVTPREYKKRWLDSAV